MQLDVIVIPTSPSFKEDRRRAERALQEGEPILYYLISGQQNNRVNKKKPETYSLSQRYQIYKYLRTQGILPRDMIISRGANTEENVLYALPKIQEKFPGEEEINVGWSSYPKHLDRFEKTHDKFQQENPSPMFNFHKIETKATLFNSLYELARKVLKG